MKPVMELLKQFFVQRSILYSMITFFSFFVIVPLGDLRLRFTDGHCSRCLLYTDFSFPRSNNTSLPAQFSIQEFGDQEVCEYSLAVTSVFSLIYPLLAMFMYLHLYRKDAAETREENKTDLGHFLFLTHVLVELVMLVLVLVSGSLVSQGFSHICQSLSDGLSSCSDAQNSATSWGVYDGSNFYLDLMVATTGSWLVFVCWLLQGMLGVWKLWRLNMLPVFDLPCGDRGGDVA